METPIIKTTLVEKCIEINFNNYAKIGEILND